jgi:HAD superfamily hydrolase (TIGR01509 family)
LAGSIKTLLFDLDGTLRHNDPNGYETFVGYLAELGHPLPPDTVRAGHRWTHYYWSIAPEMRQDLADHGGETPGFWTCYTERQLRAVGFDGQAPALAQAITGLFNERYRARHHVPEDVVPTLTRLRERGHTLGLVSNRRDPLDDLAFELGLAGLFDFTLSAGQAGSWKPDAGIFRHAVGLAGSRPEQVAYIGDNYYADILGAEAAGLHPILIDPLGIFPEAQCPVIHAIGQVDTALAQLHPQTQP